MENIEPNEPLVPRDRRSADWFWVHKTVWGNSLLSAADKIVYGTMALFANGNSQRLFPSVMTIAKFSCLSERQVRYSISNLKKLLYIDIDKHPGASSSYTLLDIGGAKFAPLQNSTSRGAKYTPPVVQNSTTNNNKEQELIKKDLKAPLSTNPEPNKEKVKTEILEKTRKDLIKKGILPKQYQYC